MARKAPGKTHRKRSKLLHIAGMSGDEVTAQAWSAERRWPNGLHCLTCGSFHDQSGIKNRTMTHRPRNCPGRPKFSLRKCTIMKRSEISCSMCAIGLYLFTASLKGISSVKLHRESRIGQKAAWFMPHRLRATVASDTGWFTGRVEVDETYMGRKMSNAKRRELAEQDVYRGTAGKTAVAGVKDRATRQVQAKVVQSSDKPTIQGFVTGHAAQDATVCSDEAGVYADLPMPHEAAKRSVSKYARGQAHNNGMESFWSMLKRGHAGVNHKMPPKRLNRCVNEFQERRNVRERDSIDQTGGAVESMGGKRFRYRDLIKLGHLPSEARG